MSAKGMLRESDSASGGGSQSDPGQLSKDVEITIVVKAFRGDPLPVHEKTIQIKGEEGQEEKEGDKEADEEDAPPPSLEELECT